MGVLVLDMETGIDAIGDDAGLIAIGGGWRRARDATTKQESDPIRPAQIEILANHGLEEVAPLHRAVEDLRETDFELAERDPMIVAGASILGSQRPGKSVRPAIEKLLNVTGPELVAEDLQAYRIGARQKAIVETGERDLGAPELLLHPLVPVQTDLDGIRHIRTDLNERRPPVLVLHIEVIMVDGDRLPREVERHAAL